MMRISRGLQVILLFAGPRVLGEGPFNVAARALLQSASPDLEEPHGHARPNLSQLHIPVPSLDENVVPDLDVVILAHEAHNTVADLSSFTWGEKVLQNLNNTST